MRGEGGGKGKEVGPSFFLSVCAGYGGGERGSFSSTFFSAYVPLTALRGGKRVASKSSTPSSSSEQAEEAPPTHLHSDSPSLDENEGEGGRKEGRKGPWP